MTGAERWRALGLSKPFADDQPATGRLPDLLMFALRHPTDTVDPVVSILANVCSDIKTIASVLDVSDEHRFIANTLVMFGRRIEVAYLLLRCADTSPMRPEPDEGPVSQTNTGIPAK